VPNPITSLDAGMTRQFHVQRPWPDASEFNRYRDVKLHSALFGWSNPDQTLRVAAGILGKRASGGWTQVRVCCQGCEAFPTMHRTWEPRSGVELELGDMVKTN
jgi:hypothetical protein